MNDNMEFVTARPGKGGLKKYIGIAASVAAALGICICAAVFSTGSSELAVEDEQLTLAAAEVTDCEITEQTDTESVTEEAQTTILSRDRDNVEDENAGCLKLTIAADGEEMTVFAKPGSTVSQALDKAGVVLNEDDILSCGADDKIINGSVVSVNRVEYVHDTQVRSLDYKTVYRDDDSIPEGDERILVEGIEGEVIVELVSKMVDGERRDVEVVGKEVSVPVVNRVVLRGTMKAIDSEAAEKNDEENEDDANERTDAEKPEVPEEPEETEPEGSDEADEPIEDITEETVLELASVPDIYEAVPSAEVIESAPDKNAVSLFDVPAWLEFDENGVPKSYTAAYYGKSCAYTAKPDALMSTGKTVFQGYVAVDPDIIPYGSELYIIADDGEVYGYAIAADTGYSVRAGKIIVDLFMNEYDDCIQWGAKNVTIYVLK